MLRIRLNYGKMPFDRNGVHATGREVFVDDVRYPHWMPEYEGDDTVDFPETEDPAPEDEEWD